MLSAVEYGCLCTSSNICSQIQSQPNRGQLIPYSIHRFNIFIHRAICFRFRFFASLFIHSMEFKQTHENIEGEKKKSMEDIIVVQFVCMVFMSLGLVRMRACNQLQLFSLLNVYSSRSPGIYIYNIYFRSHDNADDAANTLKWFSRYMTPSYVMHSFHSGTQNREANQTCKGIRLLFAWQSNF